MKKRKFRENKSGFTLIELLAVIVIMGILLLVAIPSISRVIENSRKDTFVTVAKSYVESVIKLWATDNLSCTNTEGEAVVASALDEGTYYVMVDTTSTSVPVLMDSGGKSPWGNRDIKGYVKIVVEQVSGLYGDLDHNGRLTANDAMTVVRFANGIIEFSEFEQKQADVDGNGVIDETDADLILELVNGLIEKFPVEAAYGTLISDYEVVYYPVLSDGIRGINMINEGSVLEDSSLVAGEDLVKGDIVMSGIDYYLPAFTTTCFEN